MLFEGRFVVVEDGRLEGWRFVLELPGRTELELPGRVVGVAVGLTVLPELLTPGRKLLLDEPGR